MTSTILGVLISASLAGTGGVFLKYVLDRRDAVQQEVQVEHNLQNVIGDIVEEHIQRKSEDSDTEIKINIHTHHKEKEENGKDGHN